MIIDPPKTQDGEQVLTTNPQSPGQAPTHLHLDPGPKQRSSRRLSCKCLCLGVASLVIFVATMLVASFLREIFMGFSRPHSNLYQNTKSGIVSGPTVVKPLVGKKGELGGLFDLRATVWIKEKHLDFDSEATEPAHGENQDGKPSETVLFTGTVFSGVSLQDRHLKTDVDLQIPTELFKSTVLRDTDLRASFILIPNKPSLLDYAVNLSTSNPRSLVAPVRPYPSGYQPTLTDDILDSFGISIQLLEFHPIQTKCTNTMPSNSESLLDFPMDVGDIELEPEANPTGEERTENLDIPFVRPKTTVGFHVLESHPYVITRTFLKVADMTRLYANKGYDEHHKNIKATRLACLTNKQTGSKCNRVFPTYGNFETKIRLQGSDGKRTSHEWAYGPFITTGRRAWGPLDLIPAPINREICAPGKDGVVSLTAEDKPFVNVTWHIAYSGRTPGKIAYADVLSEITILNMTATEQEKKIQQWEYTRYQGMLGNPYRDDFHPRREMLLDLIGWVLGIIHTLITAYYFYILTSTVGLSTIGLKLVSIASVSDYVISAIFNARRNNIDGFDFFWDFIYRSVTQIPALLMLKAAYRADLEWTRSGMLQAVPRIRISLPTHRERASQRIEARIPWMWSAGAFCLIGTIQHFFPADEYYIISPRNFVEPPQPAGLDVYLQAIQTFLVLPSLTLGRILQVAQNHYARTFAGTYKLAVWVSAIGLFCKFMAKNSTVVGYREVHPGFPLALFLILLGEAVDVVQAWAYPAVAHVEEGVDVQ